MMSSVDEKPHYTALLSQPLSSQRDHDEESLTPPPPYHDGEIIWKKRFYTLLISSIAIILSLTAAFAYHYTSRKSFSSTCPIPIASDGDDNIKIPFSPAPVTYLNKFMNADPETSKFLGDPRPELDQAWHELLDGTLIYFTDEELHRANHTTSIRRKGGGFVGGLGVSHSLHCLKRIKQYLHPHYYYPNISTTTFGDETWKDLTVHVDHCLESLRQEVLCKADTNVYTLHWTEHSKLKPSVKVPQQSVCVDWGGLHGWMKERGVGFGEMVHPESHFAKTGGKGGGGEEYKKRR
ncbi:hypothetical protein QBC40DRAFT_172011 [Triangularia verruculosa]|uniref:Uncharacterized protein n=1 Tax=Triangularia verruculosa TaxID=2587418 RepID=A0AAN6XIW9_9PEZI|nr:hypothetical protein QBC40DRAFT_172011 [Triangularia verruculosa]